MLVRFAPGTGYPAHRHGDVEECHILHGELCVDDKKFEAGDFIRAEAGSVDLRVWTETGCTCVVMTSLKNTML
jgi:anti-sigma factor ChrR (cupin superfamily)